MAILYLLMGLSAIQALGSAPVLLECEPLLLPHQPTRIEWMRRFAQRYVPSDYARNTYGLFDSRQIERSLESIGNGYSQLAIDPGVADHFDEFSDYLIQRQTLNFNPQDPWAARELYIRSKPRLTYYRAIAINRSEAKKYLEGLESPLLHYTKDLGQSEREEIMQRELKKGLQAAIRARFGRVTSRREALKFNPLMSVSQFPEIAVSVAASVYGDSQKDSILLFEVELPPLDVIAPGESKYFKFPLFVNWSQRWAGLISRVTFEDGRSNSYPYDHRVESFVPFRIDPTEVRRAFLIPKGKTLPHWSGKFFEKEEIQVPREDYLNGISPYVISDRSELFSVGPEPAWTQRKSKRTNALQLPFRD